MRKKVFFIGMVIFFAVMVVSSPAQARIRSVTIDPNDPCALEYGHCYHHHYCDCDCDDCCCTSRRYGWGGKWDVRDWAGILHEVPPVIREVRRIFRPEPRPQPQYQPQPRYQYPDYGPRFRYYRR